MRDTSSNRLGESIRAARIKRGLTIQELADATGCAKSYISAIENGRRRLAPTAGVLPRLESALGLSRGSLQELAAWQRTPKPVKRRALALAEHEHTLRRIASIVCDAGAGRGRAGSSARVAANAAGRAIAAIDPTGELQRLIDSAAKVLQHPVDSELPVEMALPVQAPLVTAQHPDPRRHGGLSREYVRAIDAGDQDAFAFRVPDDSMNPEYREGDIVVFSPARTPAPGMDCFVRFIDTRASVFARIYFESPRRRTNRASTRAASGSWVRLQPLNPARSPMLVRQRDVASISPAVCVARSVTQAEPV